MDSVQGMGFGEVVHGLPRAEQVHYMDLTLQILDGFSILNAQDPSRPNFTDRIQALVGIHPQVAEPMLVWLQANPLEALYAEAQALASSLNIQFPSVQGNLSGQPQIGDAGASSSAPPPPPPLPLHKQNVGLLGYHSPDPNEPIDWKSLALQRNTQYVGVLRDFSHAMSVKAEYMKSNNNEGSAQAIADFPDGDIPAQRELVKEIYEAIVDVSNVMDAQRKRRGAVPKVSKRRRTQNGSVEDSHDSDDDDDDVVYAPNHQVRRVQDLSIVQGEILAWQLLGCIRDAQYGHVNIATWSHDHSHDKSFPTFRARLDCVIDALRSSKAIVSSFMNADIMRRVAAHPKKELKRKTSNKLQNADRDVQVKVGIHAMKNKQVVVAEDGIYDLNNNKIDAKHPQPRKLLETTSRIRNRRTGLGQISGLRPIEEEGEEDDLPEFIPVTTPDEVAAPGPAVAGPSTQLNSPMGDASRQEADDVIYIQSSPISVPGSQTSSMSVGGGSGGQQPAQQPIQSLPPRPRGQRLFPFPTPDNPMGNFMVPVSSSSHHFGPTPMVPTTSAPNHTVGAFTAQGPTSASGYGGPSQMPTLTPQMPVMPQQMPLPVTTGNLELTGLGMYSSPLIGPAGQNFDAAGPSTINPAEMALAQPLGQQPFHVAAPLGFRQPTSVAEQIPGTSQAISAPSTAAPGLNTAGVDAEWWQNQNSINDLFDQFIAGSSAGSSNQSFWS